MQRIGITLTRVEAILVAVAGAVVAIRVAIGALLSGTRARRSS
jgi:hypothetical protein